ncbi:ABC transporter permease [Trebonia kvetii]|uniref:ABC transporter permease n=1 Tax=Trebonia kvetii TaxID=2480626 RepID=A0A6P2C5S8_9ACTN|nr:FtsX-like permease family protein [Trebonia kvetii]TVZ05471.1 ABC transporter permease [Trebonia kvetii]
MATVWMRLRADMRARWRVMLGLALLRGLVGGAALTAAAGARRTETAYPRLLAWANASQVTVIVTDADSKPQAGVPPGATAMLLAGAAQDHCPPGVCTVTADQRPGEIKNYTGIRDTPLLLGLVLAVLAVGTLIHVLVTGVRRRRRDLAVLKALGCTRWRPLLGLALLLGLLGGVVLAAAAGARRTDTAYPRSLAWANASQMDIVPQGTGQHGYFDALAKLPQVQSMATGQLFQAALPSHRQTPVQLISSLDGGYGTRVDRARILAGHLFNENTAGQAMINQAMAAAEHLRPGDKVRVLGVPNSQKTGTPDYSKAAILTFTVTAIVTLDPEMDITDGGYGAPAVLVTAPFTATSMAGALSFGTLAAVRLVPGTSVTRFIATASALAVKYKGTLGRIDVISQADQVTALEQAARPQAVALAAFAALAGLIALAVLSQLLSRQLALEAAEFPVLRAFGATRGTLVAISLARLAIVTVTGAIFALGIAVAASPLMPIGPARAVEPAPGVEVNLAILGAGVAMITLLPLLVLSPVAWRTATRAAGPLGVAEPGSRRGRPSRLAALLTRTGSVPGSIGVRLAFEPGRGRTAVPVRSALAGSIIAVAAVAAAVVFGTSLVMLIGTPTEYGQNWDAVTDLGFGGVTPQMADQFLAASPAVATYDAGDYGQVTINHKSVAAISLAEGSGYLTLLAGRGPRGPGEIALGARTLSGLGLRLGQTIQVTANHENSRTPDETTAMKIVGVVVLPRFARGTFAPTGLGTGAVVTASVLSEPDLTTGCPRSPCYNFFLLRYRPGTDMAAQEAGLTKALRASGCPIGSCDTTGDQRPAEIRNYASVRNVPLVLGAVLVLLAVATIAHVLLTSVRRRRRDLAVLKTLGCTRGQVQRLVAWEATALATAALLAGIPLGVLAGRQAWAFFANTAGVAPGPDVPLPLILLAIPATLLLANLIAAWPGWTAARIRPAVALRAE